MKQESLPRDASLDLRVTALETVSASTTINFTDIKNDNGTSYIKIRKSGRLCVASMELYISELTSTSTTSSVTIPTDYRPMDSVDFAAFAGGAGKGISGKIDPLGRFTIYINSSLYNTNVSWLVANVCWFTAS